MIEINLLPGPRKKRAKSGGGSSLDVRALVASLSPMMVAGAGMLFLGLVGIGGMMSQLSRHQTTLAEAERVAVQDSTRFESVVRATALAAAKRDLIMQQMSIIAGLDGERFVWPHVMDEIARALPSYTWLRSVSHSNPAVTVSPEAMEADSVPPPTLTIRVVGLTVDIQALTIFMKQLEASEFLENVTLGGSNAALVDGKQVTEFTLDVTYSKPPATSVRTVPLTIAER